MIYVTASVRVKEGKWESLEALRNHLASPHMQAHFQKEKNFVAGMTLKILKEA